MDNFIFLSDFLISFILNNIYTLSNGCLSQDLAEGMEIWQSLFVCLYWHWIRLQFCLHCCWCMHFQKIGSQCGGYFNDLRLWAVYFMHRNYTTRIFGFVDQLWLGRNDNTMMSSINIGSTFLEMHNSLFGLWRNLKIFMSSTNRLESVYRSVDQTLLNSCQFVALVFQSHLIVLINQVCCFFQRILI